MRHSRTVRYTSSAAACVALTWLTASPAAHAQINIGGASPLTYSQSFDSLASFPTGAGGTPTPFANNVTLAGLYASVSSYRISNGSDGIAGLHSFGVNSAADRALGSLPSNGTGPIAFGFRFVNTGDTAITNFQISYTGELWRIGLNSTENTLLFEYAVFAAGAGSIGGAGYTGVASLNFTEPGQAAAVAGVSGPIRTQLLSNGAGTAIILNPGEELWTRFSDANDAGNDNGMAVDEFSAVFQTAVLPEPGTFGLVALGGGPALAGFVIRQRRRHRRRSGSARRRD